MKTGGIGMSRKEEIIYAALELASVHGITNVSMAQIADKVGIRAPSLYNHFRSKEELIREMYGFLREQAQKTNKAAPADYSEQFKGKSLEEILLDSASVYIGMISDPNILKFFRVLYSVRSTDPSAARIMVEETERMLGQTRDLFYALAVHGMIKNEDADTVAMTYALTIHSLIDYRMDQITAKEAAGFAEGNRKVPVQISRFIKWFSRQIGEHER